MINDMDIMVLIKTDKFSFFNNYVNLYLIKIISINDYNICFFYTMFHFSKSL